MLFKGYSYTAITNELFSCFNHLYNIDYFFTICGDFNLANIDWKRGYDIAILPQHEACLRSYIVYNGLWQLVTEPTRNNNTLDTLIASDPLTACNVSVVRLYRLCVLY